MKAPVTLTHDVLGTRFYIEICEEVSPSLLEEITYDTGLFLSRFEENYSRFLPDSKVSFLNRERFFLKPDSEFIAILKYGQNLTRRSHGLFNMLLGSTLEARGYDSNYSFVPSATKRDNVTIPDPLCDLEINSSSITLHNGNLDLGGFGKGYVIDLLATHLKITHNLKYFLINGGGDMYGTSNYGAPFIIYLEHPLEAQTYLGTTEILNQGFAASSPHKRSWVHNGTTYHHIIHTQTESPTTSLCDASFVIADTCVEADAFATTALMVETKEFSLIAETNRLAFATYTNPTTLITNEAFIVQSL